MSVDLRFWVPLADVGARLPIGAPLWRPSQLNRHPTPLIGYSQAGPVIMVREGVDVVFAAPIGRSICLAEPEIIDGEPAWLDLLPWAVAAIVNRHGALASGDAKVADYAEKVPGARWARGTFAPSCAILVSGHRRVVLAGATDPTAFSGSVVRVAGFVDSSEVPNAPWPYGVPTVYSLNRRPVVSWSADMPSDAMDVAALRLTVAAAIREGALRRNPAQLVGNGAA